MRGEIQRLHADDQFAWWQLGGRHIVGQTCPLIPMVLRTRSQPFNCVRRVDDFAHRRKNSSAARTSARRCNMFIPTEFFAQSAQRVFGLIVARRKPTC